MRAGFPQVVRDYLHATQLYTGIVWVQNGNPSIAIKLPGSLDLATKTLVVEKIEKDVKKSLTFHIRLKAQEKYHETIDIDCLLNLTLLPDVASIQVLGIVKQIEVYAVTPDLGYLGTQLLSWPAKKRRQMRVLIQKPLRSLPLNSEADKVLGSDLHKVQEPSLAKSPVTTNPPSQSHSVLPEASSSLYERFYKMLKLLHQFEMTQIQEIAQQDSQAAVTFSSQAQAAYLMEEQAHLHAHQHVLTQPKIRRLQSLYEREYLERISFPNYPIWIECTQPFPYYTRNEFAVFCFRTTQEKNPLRLEGDGKAYYRAYRYNIQWHTYFIDATSGTLFLRLITSKDEYFKTAWTIAPSYICPTGTCKVSSIPPSSRRATPILCTTCQQEAAFWLQWTNALLACTLNEPFHRKRSYIALQSQPDPTHLKPTPSLEKTPTRLQGTYEHQNTLTLDSTTSREQPSLETIIPAHTPVLASQPIQSETAVQKVPNPIIVTHALLIDRYLHEQRTSDQQKSVEQARKYLWMHSAWIMTEALRHIADDAPLYLPTKSIYIELEQPRQLHQQNVAAFSFLQNDQHMWTLSIIDNEGHAVWTALYEEGTWTLPKKYACAEQLCTTEETQDGSIRYLLCETCQERITHYTTWITTALRMIAGDFQERIELQEPEEVLETTAKPVQDEKTGEIKKTHILHRYRIVRYYDASKYKGKEPQTKRGSWMSGRPLAESEYEINLDAVIYVQIQPRDYHRTYQHKRYIHARGKTEHIEPGPRLQPMTIATFRQLKQVQKITRVFASKFNDPQENS